MSSIKKSKNAKPSLGKTVRRNALDLSQESLVTEEQMFEGSQLPLLIRPRVEGVDLAAWAGANRSFITERLLKHGGILFRGFKVNTADEFERLIEAACDRLLEYNYRSTPRTRVSGNIYTSTEYPADQTIPLHNEMAYSTSWPMKLWFCCLKPAAEGGETPIADSRKVFSRISPALRDSFISKRVLYVRNYSDEMDLSWQTVFQTHRREEVEEFCRRSSISFEWRGESHLRTWQRCQAAAAHPTTGEMVWFNQAHLFHISSLKPELRDYLSSVYDQQEFPRNAYYGDGTEIQDSALEHIRRAYDQEAVIFRWEKGDVLMLDNMLSAHGRRPFEGERRILAGMAERFGAEEIF